MINHSRKKIFKLKDGFNQKKKSHFNNNNFTHNFYNNQINFLF